jgi:tetratricopeptide (TPR) repeat protein
MLAGAEGGAKPGATAAAGAQAPEDSLETFMAKVRRLSAEARPGRPVLATVEGNDPVLAAALAEAMVAPSPATYRAVAREYRRVGVFDQAFAYLGKASALGPKDASTYDALARLWRDSGFPQLGLGDAYRAAYYAPQSPAVHNTLGTLFQALGRRSLARKEYERALELDPAAAYAVNNLCYGWVLDGEGGKAIAACERALAMQPGLAAAKNNLGLAHAVSGDDKAAQSAFAGSGDLANELYNTGIIRLARREYASAVEAFEAARTARPGMALADARARQAKAAKGSEE